MRLVRAPCALILALSLTACAAGEPGISNAQNPRYPVIIVRNNLDLPPAPLALAGLAPSGDAPPAASAAYNGGGAGHCTLGDRFDSNEALAYNFADGRSRVGLNIKADGLGLSGLGNVEIETVKVSFRYRFAPTTQKPKEKCLYASGWQGLVGSAYNEFFLREDDTVYEALDDEWEEIDDTLSEMF